MTTRDLRGCASLQGQTYQQHQQCASAQDCKKQSLLRSPARLRLGQFGRREPTGPHLCRGQQTSQCLVFWTFRVVCVWDPEGVLSGDILGGCFAIEAFCRPCSVFWVFSAFRAACVWGSGGAWRSFFSYEVGFLTFWGLGRSLCWVFWAFSVVCVWNSKGILNVETFWEVVLRFFFLMKLGFLRFRV